MLKQLLMLSLLVFLAAGEAQATLIVYQTDLNGASEVPPNASLGTGFATITYNDALNTLRVETSFTGLSSNDTAAHIHCCTFSGNAGVAIAMSSFPVGVTTGTYDQTFNLTQSSTFNSAFVTATGGTIAGAEAALVAGLAANEAYFNIHTVQFPGGEIRGFPHVAPVPEPATWSLLGVGLMLLPLLRKRLCFTSNRS